MVEPAESTSLGQAVSEPVENVEQAREEGEHEPATLNDLLDEDAKGEHLSEFSDFSSDKGLKVRKSS